MPVKVPVKAGRNVLRMTSSDGDLNLDTIRLTPVEPL